MILGVIIQARMSSLRLPGKILRPFYKGKSILKLIVDNIKTNTNLHVVVATTTNPNDDILVEFLESQCIDYYRGDEADVLDRFINAASNYSFTGIIRVCSDNPFLDMFSLNELLEAINANRTCDYISFKVNNRPSIKTHFGFWGEYTSLQALKKVQTLTTDPHYHEHVTNYLYEQEHLFMVKWLDVNNDWSARDDIRLTTDTKDDFLVAQQIYNNLGRDCSLDEIIKFIDSNINLKQSMINQIQNNNK